MQCAASSYRLALCCHGYDMAGTAELSDREAPHICEKIAHTCSKIFGNCRMI